MTFMGAWQQRNGVEAKGEAGVGGSPLDEVVVL